MDHSPSPPEVDLGDVRGLVRYAQAVAAHLDRDDGEARRRGHDTSQVRALRHGWEFVAIALAESYDLGDLLEESARLGS